MWRGMSRSGTADAADGLAAGSGATKPSTATPIHNPYWARMVSASV